MCAAALGERPSDMSRTVVRRRTQPSMITALNMRNFSAMATANPFEVSARLRMDIVRQQHVLAGLTVGPAS